MAEKKTEPRAADWVQARVAERAAELGLSAYAVAELVSGRVSASHVYDYLAKRKSMGSHKLAHVLTALGLDLTASD